MLISPRQELNKTDCSLRGTALFEQLEKTVISLIHQLTIITDFMGSKNTVVNFVNSRKVLYSLLGFFGTFLAHTFKYYRSISF